MQNIKEDQSSLMASLLAEFNPQLPRRNAKVSGTVVMLTNEGAWVNIGQKTDSLVDSDEVAKFGLKVGDTRSFFVVSEASEDGQVYLSLSWGTVFAAQETNATVSARVTGLARAKDSDHIPGVQAEIDGLRAFIPASKLELRGPALQRLINTTIPVKVLTADIAARKIVLSQKDAADELRKAQLAQLTPGFELVGTVTNVTDFGVFANIGNGLSGLLHKSDITSNRSVSKQKLTELMPLGTQVELVVKTVDTEKGQVSLKLKEMPQTKFLKTLQSGMVLTGTVARIASFGAFVELGGCVDGLIYNAAAGKDKTAQQTLAVGQTVEVVVLNVNAETGKVSLSLQQPPQA